MLRLDRNYLQNITVNYHDLSLPIEQTVLIKVTPLKKSEVAWCEVQAISAFFCSN